jgi:hypothetical protein
VFTKVGTNRVTGIAENVVKPTQTAFMPGRHILEGVVILHETIHELHRKKMDGVLFKIDFEKAYDKVNWNFLQQAMRMKGFDPIWCQWVQRYIEKGSVGIRVNDDIGHYFQTKKGLRQGDPLSPILFNIVADMLAIIIERGKNDDQVNGLIPHLVDGGLSILLASKLTFIRVNFFVLGRLKRLRTIIGTFLGAKLVPYLLDIWESQSIFAD